MRWWMWGSRWMHRKAKEEPMPDGMGDDDNAARRRLGPTGAARSYRRRITSVLTQLTEHVGDRPREREPKARQQCLRRNWLDELDGFPYLLPFLPTEIQRTSAHGGVGCLPGIVGSGESLPDCVDEELD